MSKELEALKYLKENKRKHWLDNDISNECLTVIETALKDYENTKESINELFSENGKVITTTEIKKKLKALEIIKEKDVDILKLKECKRCKLPNEYNQRSCYSYHKQLTQEEYDLLKEELL